MSFGVVAFYGGCATKGKRSLVSRILHKYIHELCWGRIEQWAREGSRLKTFAELGVLFFASTDIHLPPLYYCKKHVFRFLTRSLYGGFFTGLTCLYWYRVPGIHVLSSVSRKWFGSKVLLPLCLSIQKQWCVHELSPETAAIYLFTRTTGGTPLPRSRLVVSAGRLGFGKTHTHTHTFLSCRAVLCYVVLCWNRALFAKKNALEIVMCVDMPHSTDTTVDRMRSRKKVASVPSLKEVHAHAKLATCRILACWMIGSKVIAANNAPGQEWRVNRLRAYDSVGEMQKGAKRFWVLGL